jgi:hypothetical protein
MAVRLTALRTGHALLPRNIIFLFLVLNFLALPEGLGKLKEKNNSRHRISKPACSIVP